MVENSFIFPFSFFLFYFETTHLFPLVVVFPLVSFSLTAPLLYLKLV